MSLSNLLVLGASGFVGCQLANLGKFRDAKWVGRSSCVIQGYHRIESYGERYILPFLKDCDVVLHLAALTRERRENILYKTNVALVERIIKLIIKTNPDVRFIFFSSDLAALKSSPYGRTKKKAESLLMLQDIDYVCLRPSMIAGYQLKGMSSSMARMKVLANKHIVLLPAGGEFMIRPVWLEDIARVIKNLANRKGESSDNGVWRMMGEKVTFRNLIKDFAALNGKNPYCLKLPKQFIIWGGKVLSAINPTTTFPLDFFQMALGNANNNDLNHPDDIFTHLDLKRTPLSDFIHSI